MSHHPFVLSDVRAPLAPNTSEFVFSMLPAYETGDLRNDIDRSAIADSLHPFSSFTAPRVLINLVWSAQVPI